MNENRNTGRGPVMAFVVLAAALSGTLRHCAEDRSSRRPPSARPSEVERLLDSVPLTAPGRPLPPPHGPSHGGSGSRETLDELLARLGTSSPTPEPQDAAALVSAAESLTTRDPLQAIDLLRPLPPASLARLGRGPRLALAAVAYRSHDISAMVRLLGAGDGRPSHDAVSLFLFHGTVGPELEQLQRDDPRAAEALRRAARTPVPPRQPPAVENGAVVLRRRPG